MEDNHVPESVNDSPDERTLPIRIVGLEELTAQYVNLLHVTFDKAAFHVVFSQFFQPPVLVDEDFDRLGKQGYVRAQPISRMVFTPLMIEQTIELLQRQLERYRHQHVEAAGEEESVE